MTSKPMFLPRYSAFGKELEPTEPDARAYFTRYDVARAEIERLRTALAKWEAGCTGRHGSQVRCNADETSGVSTADENIGPTSYHSVGPSKAGITSAVGTSDKPRHIHLSGICVPGCPACTAEETSEVQK